VDATGRIVTFSPEGQLVGETASGIKEDLRSTLSEGQDVILDLSGIRFTDSEGLAALVAAYRTAFSEGRRLAIASVRKNLEALLELTRLHRVFELHPDVDAAERAIREDR
jgi:anti-sigma B factor antagonist